MRELKMLTKLRSSYMLYRIIYKYIYLFILITVIIILRDIHTHTLCHIYIYMYTYTFTFIYIYTMYVYIYIYICKFVYTSFNPQHAAPGKLHEAIVFSFSHILPESRLRHTHRIYSRHLEHFLSQEQQQQWAEEKMQLQKDRK